MSLSTTQADAQFHGVLSSKRAQLSTPIASAGARMLAYTIDCLIITILLIFLPLPRFIGHPMSTMFDKLGNLAVHDLTASLQGQTLTLPEELRQFGHATGWALVMFVIAESVVEAGYFIFWEMLTGGRSPGKAMVGLRVVRGDGLPISLRGSIVRNLMRVVDMLPASYLVGFVAMMLSERRQRLGDSLGGTVVIRPAGSA
jgi:uncharacterized RDD family membrane protein YckC